MKIKRFFLLIGLTSILSIGIVWLLYVSSERIMQQENPFIRRFIPQLVDFETKIDLPSNSYYIAGFGDSVLYMGNLLAPLYAMEIDASLRTIKEIKLAPEESSFNFRSVQFRVVPPNFFLFDGTVPCFYIGNINDWSAELKVDGDPYFTLAEPLDPYNFVFRSNKSITGENILGILNFACPEDYNLLENLLIKQNENDGIFDTDGFLLVDKETSTIVYTYRYRNQFLILNSNGEVVSQGNTIDTVSVAKIKIERTSKGLEMSAPPTSVNLTGAVFKNHLFISSALRGKYDDKKSWDKSATIDVYDTKNRIYLFSFYLTGLKDKKLKQFFVTEDKIYALFGSQIMAYKISGELKNRLKSN